MRFLNATTLRLEEFNDELTRPGFAILSHMWGEDEVTFQDMIEIKPAVVNKKGFRKIQLTCEQALRDGLDYAWVDTCCIDKTSSAELSEAINSMYAWYRQATVCYAFLSDISSDSGVIVDIAKSRWFTRGWTLQELIAPSNVLFFSGTWTSLGTKDSLCDILSAITRVDAQYLKHGNPQSASVAERMSWAADRVTTRREDLAYCLLGILDINMPLLYGEGDRAFIRLQEEIIKSSNDQSLFAWGRPKPEASSGGQDGRKDVPCGLLATSPADFALSAGIVPCTALKSVFESTNNGIRIDAHLCDVVERDGGDATRYIMLDCRRQDDHFNVLAIPVIPLADEDQFARGNAWTPLPLPQRLQHGHTTHRLYLQRDAATPGPGRNTLKAWDIIVKDVPKESTGYELAETLVIVNGNNSPGAWDPKHRIVSVDPLTDKVNVYLLFRGPGGTEFVLCVGRFGRTADKLRRPCGTHAWIRTKPPEQALVDFSNQRRALNIQRGSPKESRMSTWLDGGMTYAWAKLQIEPLMGRMAISISVRVDKIGYRHSSDQAAMVEEVLGDEDWSRPSPDFLAAVGIGLMVVWLLIEQALLPPVGFIGCCWLLYQTWRWYADVLSHSIPLYNL